MCEHGATSGRRSEAYLTQRSGDDGLDDRSSVFVQEMNLVDNEKLDFLRANKARIGRSSASSHGFVDPKRRD